MDSDRGSYTSVLSHIPRRPAQDTVLFGRVTVEFNRFNSPQPPPPPAQPASPSPLIIIERFLQESHETLGLPVSTGIRPPLTGAGRGPRSSARRMLWGSVESAWNALTGTREAVRQQLALDPCYQLSSAALIRRPQDLYSPERFSGVVARAPLFSPSWCGALYIYLLNIYI